jgi:tetratricopeptide (TPR) repeat protein
MILAGAAAVVFWLYCGVMSSLSRSERPLLQNSLFHAASVALYLALATAVAGAFIGIKGSHPLMTVPAFVLVLIFGVGIGFRYVSFLLSEYMDRIHASATGVSGMKIQKTYDRAEKAEHEGDLAGAMALYGEEEARDPLDPEPPRRLAELHWKRGDRESAFSAFRRALLRVEAPEARSTLAFRLADLLGRSGKQTEERELLESIERSLAGTRFAAYARERLAGDR